MSLVVGDFLDRCGPLSNHMSVRDGSPYLKMFLPCTTFKDIFCATEGEIFLAKRKIPRRQVVADVGVTLQDYLTYLDTWYSLDQCQHGPVARMHSSRRWRLYLMVLKRT